MPTNHRCRSLVPLAVITLLVAGGVGMSAVQRARSPKMRDLSASIMQNRTPSGEPVASPLPQLAEAVEHATSIQAASPDTNSTSPQGILLASLHREPIQNLLAKGADPNQHLDVNDIRLTPVVIETFYKSRERLVSLVIHDADLDVDVGGGWKASDYIRYVFGTDSEMILRAARVAKGPVTSSTRAGMATGLAWRANAFGALATHRELCLSLAFLAARCDGSASTSNIDRDDVLAWLAEASELLERLKHDAPRDSSLFTSAALRCYINDSSLSAIARRVLDAKTLAAGWDSERDPRLLLTTGFLPTTDVATDGTADCHFRAALVDELFQLGARMPDSAGWAIDELAAATLNASLHDTDDEIASRNALKFAGIDLHHLAAAPVPELRSHFSQWLRDASRDIQLPTTLGTSEGGDDLLSQLDRDSIRIQGINSATYLFGAAVSLRDPAVGKQITQAGMTTSHIASSVLDFKRAIFQGEPVFGGLTFAGNLVGILGGLLFPGGPTPEQQIYDKLVELSLQLRNLSDRIDTHFDQLQHRLNLLSYELYRVSNDLAKGQAEIRQDLLALTELTAATYNQALISEQHLREAIDSAASRPLWQRVFRALIECPDAAEFGNLLTDLANEGVRFARDTTAGGPAIPVDGYSVSDTYARIAVCDNTALPLIGYMALRHGHRGRLATVRLADPAHWIMAAEAYVLLANKYPELYRIHAADESVRLLHQSLVDSGVEIRDAFLEITCASSDGGSDPASGTLILHAEAAYKKAVDDLDKQLTQARLNYQNDPNVQLHGYDLNLGAQQPLQPDSSGRPFRCDRIPVFRGYDIHANDDKHFQPFPEWEPPPPPELSTAEGAQRFFGLEPLVAHHLNLGELLIGYHDVGWDEIEVRDIDPGLVRRDAKAGLSVTCVFRSRDGKDRRLFSRRVNTGHRYNYSLQTFEQTLNQDSYARYRTWQSQPAAGRGLPPQLQYDRGKPGSGHGNLDETGNSSMNPENPQFIAVQLQRYWPEMAPRLLSSPELVPDVERTENIQAIARLIDEKLGEQRKALQQRLVGDLSASRNVALSRALTNLEGSRRFLIALLKFGVPRAAVDPVRLGRLLQTTVNDADDVNPDNVGLPGKNAFIKLAEQQKIDLLTFNGSRSPYFCTPLSSINGVLESIATDDKTHDRIEGALDDLRLLELGATAQSMQPAQVQAAIGRAVRQGQRQSADDSPTDALRRPRPAS